jgi:hypothetical protein
MIQIKTEITIVPAMMPRKRIRHVGNRSCGRTPRVYANEDIPCVAFAGNEKRRLGTDGSMYKGDVGSEN